MANESAKFSIDDVLALTEQYGGILNIPDSQLADIGYYRTEKGSIAPLGYDRHDE